MLVLACVPRVVVAVFFFVLGYRVCSSLVVLPVCSGYVCFIFRLCHTFIIQFFCAPYFRIFVFFVFPFFCDLHLPHYLSSSSPWLPFVFCCILVFCACRETLLSVLCAYMHDALLVIGFDFCLLLFVSLL